MLPPARLRIQSSVLVGVHWYGATGCSREPSGDDREPSYTDEMWPEIVATGGGLAKRVVARKARSNDVCLALKKRIRVRGSAFFVSPESPAIHVLFAFVEHLEITAKREAEKTFPIMEARNRAIARFPCHHMARRRPQICGKVFNNASALTKHKLTHSDERKYVCTMCGKAFKRQDHLNGHMLTHRNKKPYECKAEGCGKSYCDARSLRRHTENHHAGSKINDIIGPCSPTTGPHTPNTPGSNPSTPSTPGATSTTNGHGHAALKQLLSTEPAQTQQQKREGGRVVKPRLRIYDIELEVRRKRPPTGGHGLYIFVLFPLIIRRSRLSVLLHHVHPFADRALQIKVSSEQDGDVSYTNVEWDIGMREDVT
ncbi:hypothetical protein ALC53_06409 [Atta colombica]|uniref:C2H2-type domain-containing protein n=1 Tax=Atta colombica TaxID=520822 RepID=A0A195BG35_9HYME|nr:hypothetical protein ALC53_06409 [Atta colombica]